MLLALSLVHVVLEFPLNSLARAAARRRDRSNRSTESPSPRVRSLSNLLFPSISFLFYFLPLFFLVYCATPGVAAKNVVLLLASLVFYAWGEPRFVASAAAQIAGSA